LLKEKSRGYASKSGGEYVNSGEGRPIKRKKNKRKVEGEAVKPHTI